MFSHRCDEWAAPTNPPADMEALGRSPSIGVDLNADHLACWVLTPDGNPIGPPIDIGLDLDLNFEQARQTGRETMGRGRKGKRFRRTVAGIPTAKFRDRLAGMAAARGIAVIAVDPAYTSKWGAQHWRKPLDSQTSCGHAVSRHQAAAVVIGRRGQGHKARRRTGVPDSDQRIAVGEATVQT